mmetsp:Transcript_3740/g.12164  ORF Transcript_3740/g.12164 Transcript_3740/m.12164 type:complete len:338 (-) Transcript_3740:179-1192(-)
MGRHPPGVDPQALHRLVPARGNIAGLQRGVADGRAEDRRTGARPRRGGRPGTARPGEAVGLLLRGGRPLDDPADQGPRTAPGASVKAAVVVAAGLVRDVVRPARRSSPPSPENLALLVPADHPSAPAKRPVVRGRRRTAGFHVRPRSPCGTPFGAVGLRNCTGHRGGGPHPPQPRAPARRRRPRIRWCGVRQPRRPSNSQDPTAPRRPRSSPGPPGDRHRASVQHPPQHPASVQHRHHRDYADTARHPSRPQHPQVDPDVPDGHQHHPLRRTPRRIRLPHHQGPHRRSLLPPAAGNWARLRTHRPLPMAPKPPPSGPPHQHGTRHHARDRLRPRPRR